MSRHPTSTVRQRRRVRKPSMKHNTRRGGGEKKIAIQWTAEDMNILKALTEKKKTQFRERMLKRYTSEEIRRAFGVAATDKRSDNELLDLIYDAAVGSSNFNIVITTVINILLTLGAGGLFALLLHALETKGYKLLPKDLLLLIVTYLCMFHTYVGVKNNNQQQHQQLHKQYQQYDGLYKLFIRFRSRSPSPSPSKRKRHQPTKPRK